MSSNARPGLLLVLLAACSVVSGACSRQTAAPARATAPGLGEVMAEVGRRFEMAGRAALANRFELAEFQIGELEEVFDEDIPRAALPEEGPTAHIPGMARTFLEQNIPDLKKSAALHDTPRFLEAFWRAAAACNACHEASAKGFIEVSSIPGRGVPSLDPVSARGDHAASAEPDGGAGSVRALPLSDVTPPASLDYIAFESSPGAGRVWVPIGGTGSVDVLDVGTETFRRIHGFKTAERTVHGEKRTVGPSAVAIGDGFAYVGNRATSEVCAVDLSVLRVSGCVTVRGRTDGVAFVRSTHEVWVTTPDDGTITILDVAEGATPKLSGTVSAGGQPEGYAVDETRGLFFTNLEDKGRTVAVDVKKRAVIATWDSGCAEDGPRGIAIDTLHDLVMVACTDRIRVLDAQHDGAPLSTFFAGAGVDNIDFVPGGRKLYVAAGRAARLSVLDVGARGELTLSIQVATRDGARNAVADSRGHAFLTDSKGASLLVAQTSPELHD